MSQKKVLAITFIFISLFLANAQTTTLKGSVKDSLQNALPYANVIAKPKDSTAFLKFSITDNDGYYKLELQKNMAYTISVSYMGFNTVNFEFAATENAEKNIVLKEAPNQLQEVIIELPVTFKEDTITYNTGKFVTGEERKLKNVLKKLPGVEVDKYGGVTVQGKTINTLLVDGKKFFNGGTKLAVENIPANAIDKIQVIDNYNEIAFLKNVSDSENTAMNILLKKDKKKFAFGDIEAGKGNKDFYRNHSNLFYYSPKTTINFIGNLNNIGNKPFTFKDYLNFQGGVSAILKSNNSVLNVSASELSQFIDSEDLNKSKTAFGALNIRKTYNSKIDISGFAIFSKSKNQSLTQTINQYNLFTENKDLLSNSKNVLGIAKFSIDYKPNINAQWIFNTQYNLSENNKNNTITSTINNENLFILSNYKTNSSSFNQVIEWHKKQNTKHSFSFAAAIKSNKNNPKTLWETNNAILTGLIPVQEAETFNINQIKETNNTNVNTTFKHYWVLNRFNHIYTTIGNKYLNDVFITNDYQILDNGSESNFNSNGFGNHLDFTLNNLFGGIHYKFKWGIAEFKQGVFLHNYNWETTQNNKVTKNKWVALPDFLAKIEFNQSKKLQFNYQMQSSFTNASNYAQNFYLRSYNSVFRGNPNLENELFHTARIYYSRFSLYRGLMIFGAVNYTKKTKGIQNTVQFQDFNQYLSPEMVSNPEERWTANLSISKKIKNIKYQIKTAAVQSQFLQSINTQIFSNKSSYFNYDFSIKTLYDNFPIIEAGFKQNKGKYTSSNTTSKYISTEPYFTIDYDFLNQFVFSFEYENYTYRNKQLGINNKYQIANTSLLYKNDDSAWSFEISAQNLFNVNFKQENTFSAYVISDTKQYIFPQIIMFTIGYNL